MVSPISSALSELNSPLQKSRAFPRSRTASYTFNASEAYEKAIRVTKANSSRLNRLIDKVNWNREDNPRGGGESDTDNDFNNHSGDEMVWLMAMNVLRTVAVMTGILKDVSLQDGMTVIEYEELASFVIEEGQVALEEFFSRLIKYNPTFYKGIDWFRIGINSELIIPRFYLGLLLMRVLVKFEDKKGKNSDGNVNGNWRDSDGNKSVNEGENENVNKGENENANKGENENTVQNQSLFNMLQSLQTIALGIGDPIRGLIAHRQLLESCNEDQKVKNIQFYLEEFALMNRLWCRLYDSQTGERDLFRRKEAAPLIVKAIQNVVASLTTLESNLLIYQNQILPFWLEHAVGCCDELSQTIILETILTSIPCTFHRQTVEMLVDAVSRFAPTVEVRRLIEIIIERILDNDDNPTSSLTEAFGEIWQRISGLLDTRKSSMPHEDILLLVTPFLYQSLRLVPFRVEPVENILKFMVGLWVNTGKRMTIESVETTGLAESTGLTNSTGLVESTGLTEPAELVKQIELAESTKIIPPPYTQIGRIFDYVIEFIPQIQNIFSLPSLFELFKLLPTSSIDYSSTMSSPTDNVEGHPVTVLHSAFSCAGLALEKLAYAKEEAHQVIKEDQLHLLQILIRPLVQPSWDNGSNIERLGEQIGLVQSMANLFFGKILAPETLITVGDRILFERLVEQGDTLALVLFGEAFFNFILATEKLSRDYAMGHLKRLRKAFTFQTTILPLPLTLSRARYESAPPSVQSQLRYLLCDAPLACLIEWWALIIKSWPNTANECYCYEGLVEMLMIYEDDIVDRDVQLMSLRKIMGLLRDEKLVLTLEQQSALTLTLSKHCKRLLHLEDKQRIFLDLIQLVLSKSNDLSEKDSEVEGYLKESLSIIPPLSAANYEIHYEYLECYLRYFVLTNGSNLSPVLKTLLLIWISPNHYFVEYSERDQKTI